MIVVMVKYNHSCFLYLNNNCVNIPEKLAELLTEKLIATYLNDLLIASSKHATRLLDPVPQEFDCCLCHVKCFDCRSNKTSYMIVTLWEIGMHHNIGKSLLLADTCFKMKYRRKCTFPSIRKAGLSHMTN